ncbi:DNA-binding NarL/FixJ family response regulator [Variovorax sp. W1I1]|jgi:DNA-binding NarL/FixJ family response regulator|nr:DNA-binding NarL/FixJ family response regulator [Variovorax sp. W1I1]
MAALSYSAPGVRPDNDLLGRDKPMDRTSLSYTTMTRIYLIEDNPLIATTLTDGLQEFSECDVIGTATTSDEAIDWLKANPGEWDAAVIDVFLAKGNGLTVAQYLKDNKLPEQRTVVLMNYATSEVREGALSAGVDAVFDKSLQLEAFYDFCAKLNITPRR